MSPARKQRSRFGRATEWRGELPHQAVFVCWWRESSKVVLSARGALEGLVGPCEAGARTEEGRELEGSKTETDRNGSAHPALVVEYDDVLAFSRAFVVSFECR